jgi:RNA polymerase sigma-70 factor (ECF subfamily)
MLNKRDEQAFFNDVYKSTFPVLFRVVLQILRDQESAEEVCHDAFIKLHQHSSMLPDVDQARYWVIRVGKNLAFNLAKRRGRERRAMERVFYEPRQPSRRADQDTLEGEAIAMVRDAVDKLPRSLRDVIVLKEYGGLPYSEIAKTLGISEGNVKVRVHRARERLTNLLEGVDVQFRE